jgi:hypothetical protein
MSRAIRICFTSGDLFSRNFVSFCSLVAGQILSPGSLLGMTRLPNTGLNVLVDGAHRMVSGDLIVTIIPN